MADAFFPDVTDRIPFGGLHGADPLAFRVYEPDRTVLGKRMEDHLRIAVCLWHSFSWPGSDVFGVRGRSTGRGSTRPPIRWPPPGPGSTPPSSSCRSSGCPTSASTTGTLRPRATAGARRQRILDAIVDDIGRRMSDTGREAAVGHGQPVQPPALRSGRGHEPGSRDLRRRGGPGEVDARGDPAARRRELRAVGRPRGLRVAPEHRSRARGAPAGPLPHAGRGAQAPDRLQGDAPARAEAPGADEAPVRLRRRRRSSASSSGTASTTSTASTSRSTTRRWPATASTTRSRQRLPAGSSAASTPIGATPQNGWDTDQFPNSVDELSLALYEIVRAGGFTSGGFNFDTKLRRQSMDRTDLFHAHVGGIDTLARSLLVAARLDRGRRAGAAAQRALRGLDRAARAIADERHRPPRHLRAGPLRRHRRPTRLRPAGAAREPRQPGDLDGRSTEAATARSGRGR